MSAYLVGERGPEIFRPEPSGSVPRGHLVQLPKPDIRGTGRIQYRCAYCGELMEPEGAVLVAERSYHPHHAPEKPDGR